MKKFKTYYSTQLRDLIDRFHFHGLNLIIVGGCVRDYLINEDLVTDVDIEVTSLDPKESPDSVFQKIKNAISEVGVNKIEELPFFIIRFEFKSLSIEVSIGREESFIDGDFSHKNFIPTFNTSDNYLKKWKRRDLSINSIGYDLRADEIIDPYKGCMDIDKKLLRPLSSDFYLDPVRALRLIRFKIQLGFQLDQEIDLKNFNMSKISFFYLMREGEKVGLSLFFSECIKNKISFSSELNVFVEFSKKEKFINFRELVYKCAKNKDDKLFEQIQKHGLFSIKKYKKLVSFFNDTNEPKNLENLRIAGEDFYKWAKNDYSL